MNIPAWLERLSPCNEAIAWIESQPEQSLESLWNLCERADWMLWLAARTAPRPQVVLAACACAETALKYVPPGEERPRRAIETARRWARGEATLSEVRAANADAAYAAYAAYAAAYTAANAASAADAADAAAYAAAAAAAAAASRLESLKRMADLVRREIPFASLVIP